MVKLARSELQIWEPAVERKVPTRDTLSRPLDHRFVEGTVVQIRDGKPLSPQDDQVEEDRA